MLIANLHDVRVRVPLFHSKTKTHFEDTWSVDELPPEAQFFREAACGRHEQRRFCLEERVVERQKRLWARKGGSQKEERTKKQIFDEKENTGFSLKKCSEKLLLVFKKNALINHAGLTKNCALLQKEGTTKKEDFESKPGQNVKEGGRTETHPESTDGAVCKKDDLA